MPLASVRTSGETIHSTGGDRYRWPRPPLRLPAVRGSAWSDIRSHGEPCRNPDGRRHLPFSWFSQAWKNSPRTTVEIGAGKRLNHPISRVEGLRLQDQRLALASAAASDFASFSLPAGGRNAPITRVMRRSISAIRVMPETSSEVVSIRTQRGFMVSSRASP